MDEQNLPLMKCFVLNFYGNDDRYIFWCNHCDYWHYHPVKEGLGHRTPRCIGKANEKPFPEGENSPFFDSGYNLALFTMEELEEIREWCEYMTFRREYIHTVGKPSPGLSVRYFITPSRYAKVWCPYCRTWHTHKSNPMGFRKAPCTNPNSPFFKGEYCIRLYTKTAAHSMLRWIYYMIQIKERLEIVR